MVEFACKLLAVCYFVRLIALNWTFKVIFNVLYLFDNLVRDHVKTQFRSQVYGAFKKLLIFSVV